LSSRPSSFHLELRRTGSLFIDRFIHNFQLAVEMLLLLATAVVKQRLVLISPPLTVAFSSLSRALSSGRTAAKCNKCLM